MAGATPSGTSARVERRRRAPGAGVIAALCLLALGAGALGAAAPAPAHAEAVTAAAADLEAACPPGVPRSGFPDVVGSVHEDAVACAAWNGLTRGSLPGAYRPSRAVRRDQMASFVVRLLEAADVDLPDPDEDAFDDIAGSVHAKRISQLAALDLVRGTSATSYSPDRPVRRDQLATFLVRAYEHLQGGTELDADDGGFADTDGNTHETNIDKAATAGLAQGTSATTYEPREPVRRDQLASFVARALALGADDGHVVPRPPPEPRLSEASRLHARGIGPAEAGMSLHEVEARTGTRLEVLEFDNDRLGGRCYYARPRDDAGYSFTVISPGADAPEDPRDGIVARVSSTRFEEPHVPTQAGLGPGDPRADVAARYGRDRIDEHQHLYQPEGVYLDVLASDGEHGLRAVVGGDGRVEAIHAGYAGAITWPEGCA